MDTLTKNYLVNSYPNRGATFVAGEGMYLIGRNGEKYLDLGSNYGVSVFGCNHPRIVSALGKQLKKLITLHGSFGSDVRNEAAQKICHEKGVLLIVDEIQTGVGRTGTFLAGEQFGLNPDILCLGKGIAGGI